jgi:hypothetical protein
MKILMKHTMTHRAALILPVFLGLAFTANTLLAVPTDPNSVPDGSSSAWLLGIGVMALVALKKRLTRA